MRNRQCLYKQDATSHTKSCTSIYSVVIPIHLNREMASVYSSFSYSSLTTNLKYTVAAGSLIYGGCGSPQVKKVQPPWLLEIGSVLEYTTPAKHTECSGQLY